MSVLIKDCADCNHPHGRFTNRCLRPGCRCHERPTVRVAEDGSPRRPVCGPCPSCGVSEKSYCKIHCQLVDPCNPH
jgi:hypothetical protein